MSTYEKTEDWLGRASEYNIVLRKSQPANEVSPSKDSQKRSPTSGRSVPTPVLPPYSATSWELAAQGEAWPCYQCHSEPKSAAAKGFP